MMMKKDERELIAESIPGVTGLALGVRDRMASEPGHPEETIGLPRWIVHSSDALSWTTRRQANQSALS